VRDVGFACLVGLAVVCDGSDLYRSFKRGHGEPPSAQYRAPCPDRPSFSCRSNAALVEVARGSNKLQFAAFIQSNHLEKENPMDWNRVEGNWKQLKGNVKEQWGKLTDDDLDVIAGKRDQLEGKIQERYGIEKDKVKSDVDTWYNRQTW
jgi:uncharacterized protein YjbJ (UPF0337 family)